MNGMVIGSIIDLKANTAALEAFFNHKTEEMRSLLERLEKELDTSSATENEEARKKHLIDLHFAAPDEHPEEAMIYRAMQSRIDAQAERLKLAAEREAAKNAMIREKNRRINELEEEIAMLKKPRDLEPYNADSKTAERNYRKFYEIFRGHYFGSGLRMTIKECYDLVIARFPELTSPVLKEVEQVILREEIMRARR